MMLSSEPTLTYACAALQGSPEANLLLQLACEALGLPGGEAVGSALLEGLVCSAPAQYYAACMAVALAAPHAAARLVATASMSRVPVADLPVAVLLEVCSQVSSRLPPCTLVPRHLCRLCYSRKAAGRWTRSAWHLLLPAWWLWPARGRCLWLTCR